MRARAQSAIISGGRGFRRRRRAVPADLPTGKRTTYFLPSTVATTREYFAGAVEPDDLHSRHVPYVVICEGVTEAIIWISGRQMSNIELIGLSA